MLEICYSYLQHSFLNVVLGRRAGIQVTKQKHRLRHLNCAISLVSVDFRFKTITKEIERTGHIIAESRQTTNIFIEGKSKLGSW